MGVVVAPACCAYLSYKRESASAYTEMMREGGDSRPTGRSEPDDLGKMPVEPLEIQLQLVGGYHGERDEVDVGFEGVLGEHFVELWIVETAQDRGFAIVAVDFAVEGGCDG